MYIIRDREGGNPVERVNTLEEAQALLQKYEEEDKKDGTYTADFYEIYDVENEKS